MVELTRASSPFSSVMRGRKIDTASWFVMRSSSCVPDLNFYRMTNDMKSLSGAGKQKCVLPPVHPEPCTPKCAPCPLGNSSVTGKRINILRKSNYAEMWRPSDATPDNATQSFSNEEYLTDVQLPLSRFRQKPWCELLQLSWPDNSHPYLGGATYVSELLPKNVDENIYESKFQAQITPVIQVPQEKTFCPEPGMAHVPIYRVSNTEMSESYSVSGHKPVRARQKDEVPTLNVFHLFQTELIFDSEPPESLTQDHQPLETCATNQITANGEVSSHLPSVKDAEDNDVFCSNMSTGASSVSIRQRQLDYDIQEESPNITAECTTQSTLAHYEESNDKFLHTGDVPETNGEIQRMAQSSFIRAPESHTSISNMAEAAPDVDNETRMSPNNYESVRLEDFTKISTDKRIQWKIWEMGSGDFKEGCTFYEANILAEKTPEADKTPTQENKLKRPLQTSVTFSPIDTQHIQSEVRESVTQRLITLPVRYKKQSQKSFDTSDNDLHGESKHFPQRFSRHFSKPIRNTALSTVNLELDFELEQRKAQVPFRVLNNRLPRKYPFAGGKDVHVETTKGVTAPCTLRNLNDSISLSTSHGNMTQFVFVGKNIFSEATRDVRDSESIHPESPSAGDYICENNTAKMNINDREVLLETSNIFRNDWKTWCSVDEVNVNEDTTLDGESTMESYIHRNNMTYPKATCLSGLTGNPKVREDISDSSLNQNNIPHNICPTQTGTINETSPKTSPRRIMDNVSVVQDGKQSQNSMEESIQNPPFGSASVVSLDEVPYNSPVESPRSNNSPVDDLGYINAVDAGDKYLTTSKSSRKTNSGYHTRARYKQEKYPFTMSTNSGVQTTKYESGLRKKSVNAGHGVHKNVYADKSITGNEPLMSKSSYLALHDHDKHGKKDAALSAISPDLSHRSPGSVFSDFDEHFPSNKIFPVSKYATDSDSDLANDTSGLGYYMKSNQLYTNETTNVENQNSQKVLHCKTEQEDSSKVLGHFITGQEKFLCDGNSTDTGASFIYGDKTKEQANIAEHQEKVGPVNKNVRFSDVDKVISFRNYEQIIQDNVQPVAFFTPLSKLNTITESCAQQLPSNPVLHRQTLQLRTYTSSACTRNPMLKRPDFCNPLFRFCQRTNGLTKSSCLNDVKWSAYSYKTQKPVSGIMCVRGSSVAKQAGAIMRPRAPEVNTPCQAHSCADDNSVMYTICHKCEEELHIKFGSSCHPQNDYMLEEGSEKTEEKDEREQGEQMIQVQIKPKEVLRCGHREAGYCQLCTKVMTWALSTKTEDIQS